MFTGIVQGYCVVAAIEEIAGITQLTIELGELAAGLELGASVALNGTCVTATAANDSSAQFQLVKETLELSNLGAVEVGERVNVERSFRVGDEVGGHILSGHVACTAVVSEVRESQGHKRVAFKVPRPWMRYLMDKGFIALDGASLTIAGIDRSVDEVEVTLIPETLARTGFGRVGVGDRVNVEVDSRTQAIVDTVQQMLTDGELLRELQTSAAS